MKVIYKGSDNSSLNNPEVLEETSNIILKIRVRIFLLMICLISLTALLSCSDGSNNSKRSVLEPNQELIWKANWIKSSDSPDSANTWSVYRKELEIQETPTQSLTARIAVDSKYWLWINEKVVVFEGQLKRGPNPNDTYYDEVEIGEFLQAGKNVITILVWYFGKDGFSHKSSGQSGLLFDAQSSQLQILSDSTWFAWHHPSFQNTTGTQPNYRLAESNIKFDATQGGFDFIKRGYNHKDKLKAIVAGVANSAPWNSLIKRPIPMWKDFGLKPYENQPEFPLISKGDTLVFQLPYNAQITPYLKIDSESGQTIDIRTDHYFGGGPPNLRTEYVTKDGVQKYESLGWINGHEVRYYIPQGIKILDLKYRETGYDAEFSGSFSCNDEFYNQLWEKALRTLYITMRDNYMDCPDRERAQWWGDVVLESGESYYALSRESDLLTRKAILELMNWQRQDSTIYSPVPAGNWGQELPTQMLASVGYLGFWNYYWHTGDLETISKVYDDVVKYLGVWKLNEDGTLQLRKGGWTWGDWGNNKDIPLLFNTQYYLALKGRLEMAKVLGRSKEIVLVEEKMKLFKQNFNRSFWDEDRYVSQEYRGLTDDRSQALAVVAGLADENKFESIKEILNAEMHASPYMEKYVIESLFIMGYPEDGLKRLKKRFSKMVNHPEITTLWEGWGIGSEGFGGGTTNHAWSGGGLTILSQYVAGIYPLEAGYTKFMVKPQLGFLTNVKTTVPSVKGDITLEISQEATYSMNLTVPENSNAVVYLPVKYANIELNGVVFLNDEELKETKGVSLIETTPEFRVIEVEPGVYHFKGD